MRDGFVARGATPPDERSRVSGGESQRPVMRIGCDHLQRRDPHLRPAQASELSCFCHNWRLRKKFPERMLLSTLILTGRAFASIVSLVARPRVSLEELCRSSRKLGAAR